MVFAGLVAVTAIAILAVTWGASLRNWIEYANQQSIDLSDDMRAAIQGHLAPAEALAAETLAAIAAGSADPRDTEAFSRWLMGGLAAAPQIRAAGIVRPDSKSWSVHRSNGAIAFEPTSQADLAAVARAFEEANARGGAPYWGGLVYVNGTALINYRAVFDWPGGGQGMLAIAISTADLSRFLAEQGAKTGWQGFILYGKSRVLAHPHIHRNPEVLSAAAPALPLAVLPDPVLRHIWHGADANVFQKAASAGAEVRFHPPDDPTHIYIVSRSDRYGDTPWYYGAYTDLDMVNREFDRALTSGLLALALAALAVLAAIWIGHRLARPLRRSAEAAARIGRLELDGFQPLPESRVREFDQQATAFNQMAEGLRSFSTYVPKQLVGLLARRGFRSDIPARETEVAVLFTDIAGFTSLTEHMTAEETGRMLNEHFSLLGEVIAKEQGVIDKYIGDSIMAFWMPALTDGDPSVRAVHAALTIARLLAEDNRRRRADGRPPIRIRVGIHTGLALVGNIGGKDRVDFTVVGDTVNVAQRLQEYARNIDGVADCVVLASGETAAAVAAEERGTPVGPLPIRGRDAAVTGWKIHP